MEKGRFRRRKSELFQWIQGRSKGGEEAKAPCRSRGLWGTWPDSFQLYRWPVHSFNRPLRASKLMVLSILSRPPPQPTGPTTRSGSAAARHRHCRLGRRAPSPRWPRAFTPQDLLDLLAPNSPTSNWISKLSRALNGPCPPAIKSFILIDPRL